MQIDAHEKERLSDRDSEKNARVLTEHLTDTIATMKTHCMPTKSE